MHCIIFWVQICIVSKELLWNGISGTLGGGGNLDTHPNDFQCFTLHRAGALKIFTR